MARKDFENYYSSIKMQYSELLHLMDEAGKATAENAIDPQTIKNLELTLQPIKNSYLTLAYVEYLLNLPSNSKVAKRNERQFISQLNKVPSDHRGPNVIDNNKKVLGKVKGMIDEEMK